jgi:lysophospholipase L1-like esterase
MAIMASRRTSTLTGLRRTRLPAVALTCLVFLAPALGDAATSADLATRSVGVRVAQPSRAPERPPSQPVPAATESVDPSAPPVELLGAPKREVRTGGVARVPSSASLLLIGDSILQGVRLQGVPIGGGDLKWLTSEGRQASALPELITDATAGGWLAEADAVVIHLGTNGWLPDFEEVIAAEVSRLRPRPVYLVNVAASRTWSAEANESLARIAAGATHVTVIDWHGAVQAHPGWLRPDAVHPNADGLAGLAELIARSVAQAS